MWFEVDKSGLKNLMSRKNKSFAIFELISNAWDATESDINNLDRKVSIELKMTGNRQAELRVVDNNSFGFSDLKHSFTLFGDTEKRKNAEQRGRFNLGEKLVLSLCKEAKISSTTGTIIFDDSGRRTSRVRRECGSEFYAILSLTKSEYDEIVKSVSTLIPPINIKTTFNGVILSNKNILKEVVTSLQTELSDDEGYIRKTIRKTKVQIVEVGVGEIASLYEMGIPVVATGDKYHINVLQKVPLNSDRDNVVPSYLQTLRVLVLNEMISDIKSNDANESWVRSATSDSRCNDESITKILDHRFGKNRVSFDVKDLEANYKAVSAGYTVIKGGHLSAQEWENVRRTGSLLPAGQVTPCLPKFNGTAPLLSREEWSDGVKQVVKYTEKLAKKLMGIDLIVEVLNGSGFNAVYCRGENGSRSKFVYYYKTLGLNWFNLNNEDVDRLIIHEFGHEFSSNHLSSDYYDALCNLGAKLKKLALEDPEFFRI